MPRRCCVPGCKSNYDSTLKEKELQTTFSFPKDKLLKRMWINAIPRPNFTPSTSSVVCRLHFDEKEIIKHFTIPGSIDGTIEQYPLKRPRLITNAIPSVFPVLPANQLKPKSVSRKNSKERRLISNEKCGSSSNEISKHDYQEIGANKIVMNGFVKEEKFEDETIFKYRNTDLRIDNDGYEAVISKIETEEDDITIVHELIDANGKVLHERKRYHGRAHFTMDNDGYEAVIPKIEAEEDNKTIVHEFIEANEEFCHENKSLEDSKKRRY